MNYRVISVGKLSEPFYRAGVAEYLKRLTPYGNFELVSGLEQSRKASTSVADRIKILEQEATRILTLVKEPEIMIGLDIAGRSYSSSDFSRQLQTLNESGVSRVNFVIGAADGLADSVKARCQQLISFSPMTFPHQMAVLILTEQIYRGFRILRGEPYHK